MRKYRTAWLPGDGVGVDALKAAKIVLRRIQLDAEYVEGDIVTLGVGTVDARAATFYNGKSWYFWSD
jgi:hypothetical protein